jgi:DNA polymerase-3 subunit delta'
MQIIGHKKQRQFLKKIVNSGKIPRTLLFTGPEKIGKKTIALEMISSVFGAKTSDHPDFTLIEPQLKSLKQKKNNKDKGEKNSNSSVLAEGQIQINQIRELNWKLSLKPIKSSFLSAVVNQAHLMTKEAQNCFLKTLEEPKARSLLILITEHPKLLLPTITSRCENIKFYPVKNEEIEDYLAKREFPEENLKEIIEISSGRPGVAVDILEKPEKLEERRKRIKELRDILNAPLSLRFKYVKELSNQPDLKEYLSIWLSYFRKNLISYKNQPDLKKVKNILEAIQETIYLISTTNVNPRLALEVLVMNF